MEKRATFVLYACAALLNVSLLLYQVSSASKAPVHEDVAVENLCSGEGELECKRLKVGDFELGFAGVNDAPAGTILVKAAGGGTRALPGVTVSDGGAVKCRKLEIGGAEIDLSGGEGLLFYDGKKVTPKVANAVRTDNRDEGVVGQIALFSSKTSVSPSGVVVDLAGVANGDILTMEGGRITSVPGSENLVYSETPAGAVARPGTIVTYGETNRTVKHDAESSVSLDLVELTKPGSKNRFLLVGNDRTVVPSPFTSGQVLRFEGEDASDRLLMHGREAGSVVATSVKFDLERGDPGDVLALRGDTVSFEKPRVGAEGVKFASGAAFEDGRLVALSGGELTTLPLKFNSDAAGAVGNALVLKENGTLEFEAVGNVTSAIGDVAQDDVDGRLAVFNLAENALKPSPLKLELPNDLSGKAGHALVYDGDGGLVLQPPPPRVVVEDPDPAAVDREHLTVLEKSNNGTFDLKRSALYVENGNLVVPSGKVRFGNNVTLNVADAAAPPANGTILRYEGGGFVPRALSIGGLPIDDDAPVVPNSFLGVSQDGTKLTFLDPDTVATRAPVTKTTTREAAVTPADGVVKELGYMLPQGTSTCTVLAHLAVMRKELGDYKPPVSFEVAVVPDDHGSHLLTPRYHQIPLDKTFPFTPYVTILHTFALSPTVRWRVEVRCRPTEDDQKTVVHGTFQLASGDERTVPSTITVMSR